MSKLEEMKEFLSEEFPNYRVYGWTIVVAGVVAILAAITLLRWVL